MGMQTDVRSYHQHQTGFAYVGRTRLKALSVRGSATAARLDIFDTLTAPIPATYGQSAYTVTVTKSAHGLVTGQEIGISFEDGTSGAGVAATNSGNYKVTVVDANTFTITTVNSITITAGADCQYVATSTASGGGWVTTIETAAGDIYNNYYLLPGEGILIERGIYSDMLNVVSLNYWVG